MPSLLFLVLAAGAVCISRRYFGHLVSPFSIFYAVWCITLALFFLHWVDYIPILPRTWTLLILNLASFGAGWLLALRLFRRGVRRSRTKLVATTLSPERFRAVIMLFFILGMIGLAQFLWTVQGYIGLITYLESPGEIRQAMGLGAVVEGIKPLNWLNVANVVLCTFYLTLVRDGHRKKLWFVLIASLTATLFMQDRTRFFYAVLWAGYVWIHSKKQNAQKILTASLVVGVVLLIQFLAVGKWLGKVAENMSGVSAVANVHERFYGLLPPYIYATGNFPAFQEYVENQSEGTRGLMTFYPIAHALSVFDPHIKLPDIIGEFFLIPFPFNAYTWLNVFYSDFGVTGVVLGPLGFGLLAGLVYFRMCIRHTFLSIYANGLMCFGLTMSIFVNHLTAGPVWYFLFVGLMIARYAAYPATQRAPDPGPLGTALVAGSAYSPS